MDNIEVFLDTQRLLGDDPRLKLLTRNAIHSTRVVGEGFHSQKQPRVLQMSVSFEENLTLAAAYKHRRTGAKTGVLNFANPFEPGGGVLRGANAQEEYLCRAGNLYNCLASEMARPYYEQHRAAFEKRRGAFLASDALVYSPNVTFIKKDAGYRQGNTERSEQVLTDDWLTADVFTCAAPIQTGGAAIDEDRLTEIFVSRVRNIFEAAIDARVEVFILGAFGCGAFKNPPTTVADAFQRVLLEARYFRAFQKVVFAVKRGGAYSENIEAFERSFKKFPPTGEYIFSEEGNKRRFFE